MFSQTLSRIFSKYHPDPTRTHDENGEIITKAATLPMRLYIVLDSNEKEQKEMLYP